MRRTGKRTSPCILVAIGDLTGKPDSLLHKAASLAKVHGAAVRLVHVVAIPHDPVMRSGLRVRQTVEQLVANAKQRLARIARLHVLRGVATSVDVIWDYPASDALVRHVLKCRPELLLLNSHRHGRFARMWLSNTDWDLIRNCPCPVWFSKRSGALRGKVVAAVDPLHTHAKPADVDMIIVRSAIFAAGGDVNQVVLLHAYPSRPDQAVTAGVVEAYWLSPSAATLRTYKEQLLRAIDRQVGSFGVPPANRVVLAGDRLSQIPRFAKKYRAGLVVMGAVSRSGLGRLFIGNTAERVIDSIECDVLVVKPRGFRTPVSRRRPRARRGLV
jgi:universal stress protein E